MAKDFDVKRKARKLSEEDRTFVLHGESFVVRQGIHPAKLEEYDKLDPESGVATVLATVDELILNMIDPRERAHERYRLIREEEHDPITVEDLQDLVQWMMEVQTGRPTGQPSGSASGPSSIETGSTVASSSPVTPAGSTG